MIFAPRRVTAEAFINRGGASLDGNMHPASAQYNQGKPLAVTLSRSCMAAYESATRADIAPPFI